jgi:hypothetical protein
MLHGSGAADGEREIFTQSCVCQLSTLAASTAVRHLLLSSISTSVAQVSGITLAAAKNSVRMS